MGDVGAQGRQRQRLDVLAVDADLPAAGVVEARYQVDQRGLAAARGSDQCDGLAGTDREVDVCQRIALGACVAQTDAGEFDFAARAAQRDRTGVHLGRLVEHAEHAFRGGQAAL